MVYMERVQRNDLPDQRAVDCFWNNFINGIPSKYIYH